MNYLIDTHYILWSLFEPQLIKKRIIKIFKDENSTKTVSGVSLWEISLKYSLGKLDLENTNPDQIYEKIIEAGYNIISVDNYELFTYYKLPKKDDHKDPFDRLLIWQAILNEYTIITADEKFSQYTEDGLKVEIGT